MTVYVDDMLRRARVGRLTSRWSHLLADTSEELHEFAARLGLRREWVQHPGSVLEHYDVTEQKRARAIKLGAMPITYHESGEIVLRKREAQEAGRG